MPPVYMVEICSLLFLGFSWKINLLDRILDMTTRGAKAVLGITIGAGIAGGLYFDKTPPESTVCEVLDEHGEHAVITSYPLGKIAVRYQRASRLAKDAEAEGVISLRDDRYVLEIDDMPEHTARFGNTTKQLKLDITGVGQVALTAACVNEFNTAAALPTEP